MAISAPLPTKKIQQFPPFDLGRLLSTAFQPKSGEKMCILIDLEKVEGMINLAFLKDKKLDIQHKAYEKFYQEIRQNLIQKFKLNSCDLFAYQRTGGSNLELPDTAMAPDGKVLHFEKDIYPNYDIILCLSTDSAIAPLAAAAKKHGFRGASLHGLNDTILKTGLAVDYNEVSKFTEKLRAGLTLANDVEIDFQVDGAPYQLRLELGRQEAQKSHGICHNNSEVANLPAGEVYFIPIGGKGHLPMKFNDGTLGLAQVIQGRITSIQLLKGKQAVIDAYQAKLLADPFTGVLGELGFGTQELPHSGSDIQDKRILGTFHLGTGRNDHLKGIITQKLFVDPKNATHDDILFSPNKTPEIEVKQVRMHRQGQTLVLIENYQPSAYLLGLLNS